MSHMSDEPGNKIRLSARRDDRSHFPTFPFSKPRKRPRSQFRPFQDDTMVRDSVKFLVDTMLKQKEAEDAALEERKRENPFLESEKRERVTLSEEPDGKLCFMC